jgi:hypothetical protein
LQGLIDAMKLLRNVRAIGWAGSGFAAVIILAAGCSGKVVKAREDPKSHIKQLGILYGRFTGEHQGRGPANEKEFKDYIRKMDADQLPAGIDKANVDALFVSPRDNQPYGIVYGVSPGPPGPQGSTVTVYEKTGVDGKHYVFMGAGQVEEVDDAKLKQLVPAGR